MSNHLAVAAVSATLVQLLNEAITQDFDGATVVAGRPDAVTGPNVDPEVRVFLYRVEQNAAWRNTDLPTRGNQGGLVERPQAAINLQYLLTFVGNEADYAPQRLLGTALRTLHFHPILTRAEIGRMVQAALDGDPNHPLGGVDLADQPELIRFTPLALTIEELSNLWSSFFQVEYRLSVAYEAAVVLLNSDVVPSHPLPVRERRFLLATILRPTIRRAVPGGADEGPILPATALRIDGSQLRGDEVTVIRFGDVSVTPPVDKVTATRIDVVVPTNVRAGALGLRVEHRWMMGEPPTLRSAGQSNVLPIVVHPRIRAGGGGHLASVSAVANAADGTRSGTVNLTVDPPVGSRQSVSITLNALGGSGASFTFFDERRDGEGEPTDTTNLSIAFVGVPAGNYLVRVVVDGAESPLDVDMTPGPSQGSYAAPRVTVP